MTVIPAKAGIRASFYESFLDGFAWTPTCVGETILVDAAQPRKGKGNRLSLPKPVRGKNPCKYGFTPVPTRFPSVTVFVTSDAYGSEHRCWRR
jgi:hypothetical protein